MTTTEKILTAVSNLMPKMYHLLEEASEKSCRCGKATRCFSCRAREALEEMKKIGEIKDD